MPETFPRSARELEGDGFRRTGSALLLVCVALAAWTAWLVLARVSVYVTSSAARIEVAQDVRAIEARVRGRVMTKQLALNQGVREGDILAELDARAEQLMLAEQRSRHASLVAQLAESQREVAARQRSLQRAALASRGAFEEALARKQEAQAPARLREQEAERAARLHAEGLLSDIELLQRQAAAQEQQAVAERQSVSAERIRFEQDVVVAGLRAEAAELDREVERLRGELAASASAIARLERAVEDRRIRAPADGHVGDVRDVRVGDVVEAGASFGTVVPEGRLRVVAAFPSSQAVGRLRAGQRARVRLEGFPWTEYGTIAADVVAVGRESHDGRLRAELAIRPDPRSPIPVQHALTGTVDVEVERVSPAALVLRACTPRFRHTAGMVPAAPSAREP